MSKLLKKKVIVLTVIPLMILAVVFSPIFVKAVNGEVDVFEMVTNLFGKVEKQEEKIRNLEATIEELKAQIKIQDPKTQETVTVPKEPEETEKEEETPVVEEKEPEEKPDPKPDPAPTSELKLQVSVNDGYLKLSWTKESSSDLQGYKVVISKSNPSPSYPNDGYLKWITDRSMNYLKVDNSVKYNGGDFGGYLKPSTAYYFSITYVYNDKKVTTDPVKVTTPANLSVPETSTDLNPDSLQLQVVVREGDVKLLWTKEPSSNLQGYKVVISQSNSEPSYPDDGYLAWISDRSMNYFKVDNTSEYHGGDIGGYLKANTEYYFSITYVYNDKKVTTDAVRVTTPAGLLTHEEETTLSQDAIALSIESADTYLRLTWTEETCSCLQGYKVVISKSNPSPSYPDDGYLAFISDSSTHSYVVDNSNYYNGGDILGYLQADTAYYFSITYIYDGKKVTSPTLQFTTPLNLVVPVTY